MTTTHTPAARVSGTIKARSDLFRDALRFAYLAAGEGIEIDGLAPEDFLMAYSEATGDEEWDTFVDRLAATLPATEPQPVIEDADMKRCSGCGSVRDRRGMDCLEDGTWRCVDCTPSSAGTVSVEAAIQLAQKFACEDVGFEIALRALAGDTP